jgi:hypothetical protein
MGCRSSESPAGLNVWSQVDACAGSNLPQRTWAKQTIWVVVAVCVGSLSDASFQPAGEVSHFQSPGTDMIVSGHTIATTDTPMIDGPHPGYRRLGMQIIKQYWKMT